MQCSSVNKFVVGFLLWFFFSVTSPPSLWDGVKRNVGVADSLFPHAQYWCWYENTKIQEQPELLTSHSLQLVG